jgi:uncharacterized protein (TIGR02284 family)
MATMTEHTVWLNRLLRGELAAVETYQQALEKMKDAPEATELHALLADHQNAVQVLRKHIAERGGTPVDSSGAWGTWAKFIEGAAIRLGNTAALEALRQGEQHGIKEYERALEDDDLDSSCRGLIRDRLLPQARSHIPVLDRLIDFQ